MHAPDPGKGAFPHVSPQIRRLSRYISCGTPDRTTAAVWRATWLAAAIVLGSTVPIEEPSWRAAIGRGRGALAWLEQLWQLSTHPLAHGSSLRGGCSGVAMPGAAMSWRPPNRDAPCMVVATWVTSHPAVRVVMSEWQ